MSIKALLLIPVLVYALFAIEIANVAVEVTTQSADAMCVNHSYIPSCNASKEK